MLLGLYLQGFARVWSFVTGVVLFAEITARRSGADSRRKKCSLGAFLGRPPASPRALNFG